MEIQMAQRNQELIILKKKLDEKENIIAKLKEKIPKESPKKIDLTSLKEELDEEIKKSAEKALKKGFDPESIEGQIQINEALTVIETGSDDVGIVHTTESAVENEQKTFKFKILSSTNMNIVMGADRVQNGEVKQAWLYTLATGEKGDCNGNITPYTETIPKEGDEISMIFSSGHLSFKINETDLGVAFSTDDLNTTEVFPSLMLGDGGHKLQLML